MHLIRYGHYIFFSLQKVLHKIAAIDNKMQNINRNDAQSRNSVACLTKNKLLTHKKPLGMQAGKTTLTFFILVFIFIFYLYDTIYI